MSANRRPRDSGDLVLDHAHGMRTHTFRAPCFTDAMAQIRDALGPDALILSSREDGDALEMVATLDEPSYPAEPSRPTPDGCGEEDEHGRQVAAWQGPAAATQAKLGGNALLVSGFLGARAQQPPSPPSGSDVPRSALRRALSWHKVPDRLIHTLVDAPVLADALAAALRFGSLPLTAGAKPLFLVGPPGAGKTLTVARLATRMVLDGVAPMLITTDARRAGATEQLAAFARLLDVRLAVATKPDSLRRALTSRSAEMPVLVDTSACDPFDPVQHAALAALVRRVGGTMALVLPAGLDAEESADIAAAFAACGATQLIATRLDASRRLGGVLAAAAAGLTLTEAGVGASACDGLVPLTPAMLAERLAVGADTLVAQA